MLDGKRGFTHRRGTGGGAPGEHSFIDISGISVQVLANRDVGHLFDVGRRRQAGEAAVYERNEPRPQPPRTGFVPDGTSLHFAHGGLQTDVGRTPPRGDRARRRLPTYDRFGQHGNGERDEDARNVSSFSSIDEVTAPRDQGDAGKVLRPPLARASPMIGEERMANERRMPPN